MAYRWYRTGELVERDVFGDITIRYVDKVVTRLHGISFGEEEYVGGFRIAGRITIILENDFDMEYEWDIGVDTQWREITLKKNPRLVNNFCWFSLISGNIKMYEALLYSMGMIIQD